MTHAAAEKNLPLAVNFIFFLPVQFVDYTAGRLGKHSDTVGKGKQILWRVDISLLSLILQNLK
jgi:hypothetical protein